MISKIETDMLELTNTLSLSDVLKESTLGGGTFKIVNTNPLRFKNAPTYDYGFWVSFESPTLEIPPIRVAYGIAMPDIEANIETIVDFIKDNESVFLSPDVYFGIWRDQVSGIWYFDASTYFEDIESAIRFAQTNKQLAIFDIARGETVYV